MTILEPVVVGPALRPEGRDFGLRRSPSGLSGKSRVYLEDFALSLSEWANRGEPHFELLLQLLDDDLYLLLKGGHLGRGTMGPIAVAQGLLIPRSLMESLQFRANRLLPLIPQPVMAEWCEAVAVPPSLTEAHSPGSGGDLEEMARELAETPAPWPRVYITGDEAEQSRSQLLEAIPWRRTVEPPTWVTTHLPRLGRFDSGAFTLQLRGSGSPREGDYHVRDGHVMAGLRGRPPAAQVFDRMFRRPDDGPHRFSAEAIRAVEGAKWRPAFAGESVDRVVGHAIADLLEGGLTRRVFWDILEILAGNASRLKEAGERAGAARGVASFFAASAHSDPDQFAPLLSRYMHRVWNHLPGEEELPLKLALDRDAITRITPDDLRRLLDAGIANRFPDKFQSALRRDAHPLSGGGSRMPAAAAIVLLDSLQRSERLHGIDSVPIGVAAAALEIGCCAVAGADAAEGVALRSLLDWHAERLASRERTASARWTSLVFGWLPRFVRATRARREGSSTLQSFVRTARRALREDPGQFGFTRNDRPSEAALTHLLVIRSVLNPRPAMVDEQ